MSRKSVSLLLSALLALHSLAASAWDLAKKNDGIEVYTELPKGSEFKAFYAITHVHASLHQLVAMQLHLDSQPDWIQDCKKSELVKRVSDREFYVYYVTHAPWPVDDRDYVLHSVIDQDPKSLVVTVNFQGVDNVLARTQSCVRAAKVEGFWRFTPEPGHQVKVEYQVHADPSGDVPAWLANSFVVDQPFQTLEKLRQHVDDPRYRNARVAFITEPPASR
ncbi:START domain-containing protein [Mangrovitalea sediminis]|uniref:START domain-containing protein n=1 Tax=Mangrovitalea sediminis TaxID=1982043 RepID=UPI000BE56AD6|nr:START domain-containing protein [Mangrovitalea sediminis]